MWCEPQKSCWHYNPHTFFSSRRNQPHSKRPVPSLYERGALQWRHDVRNIQWEGTDSNVNVAWNNYRVQWHEQRHHAWRNDESFRRDIGSGRRGYPTRAPSERRRNGRGEPDCGEWPRETNNRHEQWASGSNGH